MKITFETDDLEEARRILLAVTQPLQAPQPRPNVSPGESPISKMGSAMRHSMFAAVGSGAFGKDYGGKSLKYLQLMWKRGEIGFDGKEFYKNREDKLCQPN